MREQRYWFFLINRAIFYREYDGQWWTQDTANANNERLQIWGKIDRGDWKMEYVLDPDSEIAKLKEPGPVVAKADWEAP